MSNIYGFQLDNPTANTVVANMFLLGSNGSTNVSQSTIATNIGSSVSGLTNINTEIFFYTGDLSQIDANIGEFFLVDNSKFFLSIFSSGGIFGAEREFGFNDGTSIDIPSTPISSMAQIDNQMISQFENKVGESNVVNINTLCSIKSTSSGVYTFKIQTVITYLKTAQYILNTPSFTPIIAFKIKSNMGGAIFVIVTQVFSDQPIAYIATSLDWTSSSQTASGVNIAESTGGSYQEFAGSQTGEPIAINSLRITPLESNTYTESERISQLLQPIKFTRVDANGLSNTFALNPTVDLYQNMTTLDYINLGTKTDDFPLDGNTNFAYQLLPFSKVSIQLDYVQTSNFIFANKELIQEIIELNKEKNKQTIINSKIARTFTLNLK